MDTRIEIHLIMRADEAAIHWPKIRELFTLADCCRMYEEWKG